MADLILHIGAHKTATSFLQRTLSLNRGLLARHGLIYPKIRHYPAHHILAGPWIDVDGVPPAHYGPGGPDGLWRRFVDDHAGLRGTVLLSAEVFSRAETGRVDMADLARRLDPFDSVRVVYTVRQQPAFLQSIWLQRARSAPVPPWSAFYRKAMDTGLASGLWLDHGRVWDLLRQGFPPDRITFLDYDTIRRESGGVLGAFLRLAGVSLTADDLKPAPPAQSNISADPLRVLIATRMAEPNPIPDDLIVTLAAARPFGPDRPTSLFTRAEHDALTAAHAPLNEALEARVRPQQPDFAVSPPAVPGDILWRDKLDSRHWARIARSLLDREGR